MLGAGRALSITYSEPTSGKAITRKNVPLPLHIVLPMSETE